VSSECIFCKIAAGELSSAKVYEDTDIIAFLDIAPVVKGHTLVVPRKHFSLITDTPPDLLAKAIKVARRIAVAQVAALNADGLNVTQANGEIAGQVVPHIHFHVIPRFEKDGPPPQWQQGEYSSPEEIHSIAERLRLAVEDEA